MSEEKTAGFPKYIYKKGTGKLVDPDTGRWEAESMLVATHEEMQALDKEWCDTPEECGGPIGKKAEKVTAPVATPDPEETHPIVIPHHRKGK